MNTPKVVKLPVNNGVYTTKLGRNSIVALNALTIRDDTDNNVVLFQKEQAIQLAKELLMFWDVPFVNKGSNGQ